MAHGQSNDQPQQTTQNEETKKRSPAKWVGLTGVILTVVIALTCVGFYIWSRYDGSVNANSLIGFGGGIIAATIGGAAAVLVLQLSLAHERESAKVAHERQRQSAEEERKREIDRRRAEIASQLADVVRPSEHLAGFAEIAQRGRSLSVLLLDTWDDHERLYMSIPLLNAVDAFRDAAVELEYGTPPGDDHEYWLRNQLAPAVAELADAVTREAVVGTQDSSGIAPTFDAVEALETFLEVGRRCKWIR